MEPGGVEVLHGEKQDGKKKRDDQRERASCRFQGTADDDAPMAADQMLQHHEAKRADSQAENQQETHQIRLIEKPGGPYRSENGNQQGYTTDDQRPLLKAADALRRLIFLRSH